MSEQCARAIVNPAAGGHSIHREWPSMSRRLRGCGLSFDYVYTERKGHAIELARAAADAGCKYIIAVGGDGTISEVVNGILNSERAHDTALGILSAGTACSFARSLGIPPDAVNSCEVLTSQNRLPIDVGVVEYMKEGQHSRRYFINEADIGFGAEVVEASKIMPGYFGRRINYLPYVLGGIGSFFSYTNKRILLRADDEAEQACDCTMLVVANGKYFGGEMRMAPDAAPNDGLLDMIVFGDMRKAEIVKILPLIYQGRHIGHDKVRLQKVKKLAVQSAERILVEADGELLGEGPASFSVLPSALSVVVR